MIKLQPERKVYDRLPHTEDWDLITAMEWGRVDQAKKILAQEKLDFDYISSVLDGGDWNKNLYVPSYFCIMPFPVALVCGTEKYCKEMLSLLFDAGLKMGPGIQMCYQQGVDTQYRNALHLAVDLGQWDKVEMLIDHGVDYKVPDPGTGLYPGVVAFEAGQIHLAGLMALHVNVQEDRELDLDGISLGMEHK